MLDDFKTGFAGETRHYLNSLHRTPNSILEVVTTHCDRSYSHVIPDLRRDAARRMDDLLARPSGTSARALRGN